MGKVAHKRLVDLFEKFALEAASRYGRYSSNAVVNRVRWHLQVDLGERISVDCLFRDDLVNKFIEKHPELPGFFNPQPKYMRKVKKGSS